MQNQTEKIPVLVSSCLLGLATRYDATDNQSPAVIDFIRSNNLLPVPVCPEQLAGLPTPRPKCWFAQQDGRSVIRGKGRLCDEHGKDVTAVFLQGAQETLKIAQLTGCRMAILQQRSPSCGSQSIYLNEQLTPGVGVTAAVLEHHGLKVFSDDHLPSEKNLKDLHQR